MVRHYGAGRYADRHRAKGQRRHQPLPTERQGQGADRRAAVEAVGGTPAEAAAFIKLELDTWAPVIKAANISLN